MAIGAAGADALATTMADGGVTRALHLAGRDQAAAALPGVSRTEAVYASEPLAVDPVALLRLAGSVALLHSPRAGGRLAELVADRASVAIAAISAAAANAAGPGSATIGIAATPDDTALIAAGLALAD